MVKSFSQMVEEKDPTIGVKESWSEEKKALTISFNKYYLANMAYKNAKTKERKKSLLAKKTKLLKEYEKLKKDLKD